jgi:hypothetical protein
MKRFLATLLLAAIIIGGAWALYNRDQIDSFGSAWRLARRQLGTRTEQDSTSWVRQAGTNVLLRGAGPANDLPPSESQFNSGMITTDNRAAGLTIRIGSFKLGDSVDKSRIPIIAEICRQFDVVALQNVRRQAFTSMLVSHLNSQTADFQFVDHKGPEKYFAVIFDRRTIELEDRQWYSVNDPDGLLGRQPLVAWFRATNAALEDAFTFSLVNVQLDSQRPDLELSRLGQLHRAIRADGRGEDDIIFAGDFSAGDRGLVAAQKKATFIWAIENQPTTTKNDRQLDNIMFHQQATIEYSGESGVIDFMRHFNLTLEDAMAVSDHLPIWAEFATHEGQTPGRAYDSPKSISSPTVFPN